MGSMQIPGTILPILLIWTFAAYAGEFVYGSLLAGSGSVAQTGIDPNPSVGSSGNLSTSTSIGSSPTTLFQFLTFTVPGIPTILTLLFFFTIILPWFIIILQFIISVIPFT